MPIFSVIFSDGTVRPWGKTMATTIKIIFHHIWDSWESTELSIKCLYSWRWIHWPDVNVSVFVRCIVSIDCSCPSVVYLDQERSLFDAWDCLPLSCIQCWNLFSLLICLLICQLVPWNTTVARYPVQNCLWQFWSNILRISVFQLRFLRCCQLLGVKPHSWERNVCQVNWPGVDAYVTATGRRAWRVNCSTVLMNGLTLAERPWITRLSVVCHITLSVHWLSHG